MERFSGDAAVGAQMALADGERRLAYAESVWLTLEPTRRGAAKEEVKSGTLTMTNRRLMYRAAPQHAAAFQLLVFDVRVLEGWSFEQPWFGSNYLQFRCLAAAGTDSYVEARLYFMAGGGVHFFTTMAALDDQLHFGTPAALAAAAAAPLQGLQEAQATANAIYSTTEPSVGYVDEQGRLIMRQADAAAGAASDSDAKNK